MNRIKTSYKMFLAMIHDAFVAASTFIMAIALRYSVTHYKFLELIPDLSEKLLIVVCIQQIVFYYFNLYQGIWRFSSTHDLKQLIKATITTSFLTFVVFNLTENREYIPRSSMVIYATLLLIGSGGGRFLYRILKESLRPKSNLNVIVVGAGGAAEQLIRDIQNHVHLQYNLLGLIDDDPGKRNRTIHGVKVLGNTNELLEIAQKNHVKKIYIAMPSAGAKVIKRIIEICNQIENVEVKTLPSVKDILDGKIELQSLRKINPEDLLGREPITLDIPAIGKLLTDKNILISGAGGSIGSELCKQIAKFKPRKLIIVDISEFFLYEIDRKLRLEFPEMKIIPIVADIRNRQRIQDIFEKNQIDIVYHAAAYKQVPLMESNPIEAIYTNILGTKVLAEVAVENKISRFVMVSTDKAVNPTNVLGATKRIAEMLCQELSNKTTKFTNVRFGNVLASNGSVIPLFEEQIKNGGPVTVTHKDITRYFMSISEAAQLILQAGSMGMGGEIFVLDMGAPIKIFDFAKQMIKLSGHEPFVDIDIKITGLRPGEKLYEELLADDENTMQTPHPSVRVACARNITENLAKHVQRLINISPTEDPTNIKIMLKECVSEYTPDFRNTEIEAESESQEQKIQ